MNRLRITRVRDAILQRRPIAFSCGNVRHELSAHALGTRRGVWHVFGWDAAASPPGWRCIELQAITSVISAHNDEWQRGVPPMAPAKANCLDFIYAEVESAREADEIDRP